MVKMCQIELKESGKVGEFEGDFEVATLYPNSIHLC